MTLTAKEFFTDMGADFRALFDGRSLMPLLIGVEGFSLALIPEQRLERHFARGDVWGGWADPGKVGGIR